MSMSLRLLTSRPALRVATRVSRGALDVRGASSFQPRREAASVLAAMSRKQTEQAVDTQEVRVLRSAAASSFGLLMSCRLRRVTSHLSLTPRPDDCAIYGNAGGEVAPRRCGGQGRECVHGASSVLARCSRIAPPPS